MPASRLVPLGAVLLLGLLLLLELPPVTGTGADKPGVCPQLSADLNCTQDCRADQDCAENLKCCRAGCSAICSIPNEKEGSCPSIDFPQLGICQDLCQVDSQCPGKMKCCLNGCGKVSCVTPNF
ncbi:WAP four-disulfide core domain protein 2 precursor [Oryctolagus cuniculus]|uniref:WAP four-disulfide core domain protein 2 n=1 Tax=Oryctolagus cuniculus TaxID=9986 RepID=WFDC2_RABIT|nr:WAP four-disulfide core domain protein 2 precursor [Oryctolagus cuniculus]Q28631.2 RecName: Full=WAP four-disulfide core domain protein 2; AltName: Full=Epididymal protein BE-20; AltName: Full=Major epididymis-specific protein E4; Flags: Precursor [Oryctolagus cuniculus]AAA66525.2 epididymal protein [Oryctolagus cuniculus]